jgi:hypothetical protein
LRIRAKFKDDSLFISTAAREIPDQTIFTVQEHERWYKQLLVKAERKKNAIKNWREDRERTKVEAFVQEREDELEKMEADEERQKDLEEKRRKETKQRLEAWKEQKSKEKEEEEQLEFERKEAERDRHEEVERKKKEMQQEQLIEYQRYKERKKVEEKSDIIKEVAKTPRPPSPRDVQRVKERENQHLSRYLELKTRKIREKQDRQERIERMANQVRVEVDRDFSRVTQATESYKNRITEQQLTESDNSVRNLNFDIRHLQHLATPSWRKGL